MNDITITPDTTAPQLKAAEAASARGTTEDAPLRVTVMPGVYDLAFNKLALTKPHRVIEGPGAVLTNGETAIAGNARKLVIDGLTLDGADMGSLGGVPLRTTHDFINVTCKNLQKARDGFGCNSLEGETLKGANRLGTPTKDEPWVTRFSRCHIEDWVGAAGTTHAVYLHGRYAELIFEDGVIAGGASSALKTTRNVLKVRRSKLYAESRMLRGELPTGERALSKFIDAPSSSEVILTDNEFHCSRRDTSGNGAGITIAVWFNARRSLWSTDDPSPSDITYQRDTLTPFEVEFSATNLQYDRTGVYATLGGKRLRTPPRSKYLTVEARPIYSDVWYVTIHPDEIDSGVFALGIEADGKRFAYKKPTLTCWRDARHLLVSSFAGATPELVSRYALPEFWQQLGEPADPLNEQTFKKYVSRNRFVRHHSPAWTKRVKVEAIRDEGTYPIAELKQFAVQCKWHTVPPEWRERSVSYLYENTFDGWTAEEFAEYGIVLAPNQFNVERGDQVWGPGPIHDNPEAPQLVRVQPQSEVVSRDPAWMKL